MNSRKADNYKKILGKVGFLLVNASVDTSQYEKEKYNVIQLNTSY